MRITLSPYASLPNQEADTPPSVSGEVLSYRGQSYDLSQLPEGATVEAESPFCRTISRINGVVHVKLEYIYDSLTAEDDQSHDWADFTFEVTDGQCPDPIVYKPVEEPAND